MIRIYLDDSVESYRRFLLIKQLPRYEIHGRMAIVPDEYAATLGVSGEQVIDSDYLPRNGLFDYQRDIVRMAIQKRKFAIFADCGLGKTLMLLEFARHVRAIQKKPVLIVSPLMVVPQTIAECRKFYGDSLEIEQVEAKHLAQWMKKKGGRLGITNYDALRDDTPQGNLGGLILDESSMLKSHYGKWGQVCLRLGAGLDWKLALTGTPAPNDRIEYANHAVFLDAFPNVNAFLARFFINRGQTAERWELKPHALRPFYRALSHWCIFLTDPSTYGWKDNVHSIPPIHVNIEEVRLSEAQEQAVRNETGQLFVTELGGITTRSKLSRMAKCDSSTKPQFIADMVKEWPTESTIIWCRYNDEQRAIEQAIPEAASIDGGTSLADRQQIVDDFKAGRVRVLITKPKILGFGLNLQVCTRQVFSGLQDSYEEYYQAVKRSNRVGSTRPLQWFISRFPKLSARWWRTCLGRRVASRPIPASRRRCFVTLLTEDTRYHVHHGDCIPHMLEEMPAESVDFSVFSPPFPSLFAYTSKAEDIGNSEDMRGEAKIHLSYFFRGLRRVLKPGRAAVVHVMQIPRLKRSGEVGLHDYRGLNIRLGERAGLVYEYDWVVRKNPQAQAIRTRSRELQFAGLESDRAKQRGALPDYLIKFRAPGDNAVPIDADGEVSRNEWIDWAECCWNDIRETNTLNVREAKSEDDTKHICPLQLDVIDRLVRLYSNPGETVFSPFTGIGSEGYVSLQRGRRFYGCELKPEYHTQALRNLSRAEVTHKANSRTLFDKPEAVA